MLVRAVVVATVVAFGVVLALQADATAMTSQEQRIAAADVVEQLTSSGDAIGLELADVVIDGTVDLRSARVVTRSLRCLRCTFEESITATDVTFDALIELVDSTFAGPIDARGARFGSVVVFDGSSFQADVDFGSASFGALASFDDSDFLGDASFDRSTFNGRATFAGRARSGAGFEGVCRGRSGVFAATSSFASAEFAGPAVFRSRCFAGRSTFEAVVFGSGVDMSSTIHGDTFDIMNASFGSDASFRLVDFGDRAQFAGSSIAGNLDFLGSTVRADLNLDKVSGRGSVVLTGVTFPGADDPRLEMDDLAVDGLKLDLSDIDRVKGPTVALDVLERVETTARTNGEVSVANDARFELLVRRNADLNSPWRWFDRFFYGSVAGYLVRPTHPLAYFAGLVGLAAAVRGLWAHRRHRANRVVGYRGPSPRHRASHRVVSALVAACSALAAGLAKTLRVALQLKWPGPPEAVRDGTEARLGPYVLTVASWTEWFVYKALAATFLIGVGNANQTIRELIDSVF